MKRYSGNLTEKVSVNVNTSTLAAMDLLVDNGYYSNRSDFINQALREAIQRNEPNIQRCSEEAGRKLSCGEWFMGVRVLTLQEVEEYLVQGRSVSITGYGVLCVGNDIPAEKLFQAVSSIQVRGKVAACQPILEHYSKLSALENR